jgi:CCR4-NOT transcriptional regulation complex NOT5 subunit
MLGRRFLILVAVLMGLTALAASVAPRQQVARDDRAGATPTPTPAPSPSPSASGSPTTAAVEKTLTTSGETRVRVREGDRVELTVTGPERDSVSVLGRLDAIDPTTAARFSLLPGKPGEYPIELVAADRRIGMLVVR